MLRVCLLFILCSLCLVKPAQALSAAPRITIGGISLNAREHETDSEFDGDFKTITVPIKRAGSLIIVEAQIDTLVGNFVLDTGAPYLILNATYFRDLPHLSEKDAGGVNGSASNTFCTVVHNFSILDLHYQRLSADVTDLSRIENSKGIKILGLLGTRLFNKLAITVDLFKNVLYIHRLDNKGEIAPEDRIAAQPDMKTSFKLMNDVVFLKGNVNDASIWFVFDTGAESNLLDYNNFKKLAQKMRVVNRSVVTGVGGQSDQVIYAAFDKLVIGNYLFTNNHILFTRLDKMGEAYGNTVDAMLGYDFFSRGIFTINFAKKEFEMYIYTYTHN